MSLDALKFMIEDDLAPATKIKVVGVGGGGSNAVARMLSAGLSGVDFYVVNTDAQALNACPVAQKLAIGQKITNGLGAGSEPSVGRQAALEDTERIIESLEGADMVFVTAGLGGGTGTGAAPVVASLAKELNALTVAVVTLPFEFEGPRRRKQAEQGLAELAQVADTVITIPNDQLLELAPRGTSFLEAFRTADDVLRQAVEGISTIIVTPGLINRDFSDIRAIMTGMGHAVMGTATARGENATLEATRRAISSPLMNANGVRGARGVLINITATSQLGLHEVNEACATIRAATANEDTQINFGVVLSESMDDEVKVTVIATGFDKEAFIITEKRRPLTIVVPEIVPPPPPSVPQMEFEAPPPPPAPEHIYQGPAYEPPAVSAAAAGATAHPPIAEPMLNDLETPAFLRNRRSVQ
jgi:cell division protein FtsZ